jgi:hypothetical protein
VATRTRSEQARSDALANARPLEGRAGDEPTGWLVVELDGNGSIRPSSSDDISLGDLGEMEWEIWSTPTRDEVDLGSPAGGGDGGSPPTKSPASDPPDPIVGTWEGSVTQQSSGTTYTVEMTLFPRDADDHVGSVTYPTLGCEGYYTLESHDGDGVTLVEHITVGRDDCIDGAEIVLTTLDADRLSYTFEFAGNPEDGQGTLTRSD